MRKYNRKKKNNMFLLVLLILGISIGFAFLSTTLNINGIAGINKNTWDIHWDENSVEETEGGVVAKTAANVSDQEKKNVTFDIELELPGDFYEFTLDAKNYGTINGEIDNFDITIYQADGVTPYDGSTPARTLPSYIKYSFKYADGSPVEDGDVLEAGQSKKYRFRIEYDPEATELPDEPQTIKPVITIPELQTREEDNKPYTIMFNPNGGTVSPTTKRVERGTAIGELPTPTRENYPFLGWYTGLTDGEKITAATIPDGSTTYYAHWATSYTTLDTGKNVNTKMKTLAGNTFTTDTPWNEVNTNIAAFVRSNTAPPDGVTTQIISVDGQTPVYAWFDSSNVIRYYTEAEYIYLNADSSELFNNMRYIDGIDLTGLNSSNLTNTSNMFNNTTALTLLNISTLDTSNVIDMSGMFAGCSSMSSLDLRNLDVSSVTSMSGMFAGSSNLNSINVSTWNTNSLTNIGGMFSGCSSLTTLDLSSFNTSNVNNMGGTFSGCNNLRTLKLNNWNFTNFDVSSLMMVLTGGGFNSLQTFELNNTVFGSNLNYVFGGLGTVQTFSLENADVSRATNMSSMFNGDRSVITLDLTSFDTSNVSNMSYMFYGMTNLTTITVSDDFVVNQVSSSDGMFSGDTNLVGGRGTVYDANHIDKEYARYDKGVSRPGYFNKANVVMRTVTFNANGGEVSPTSKQVYELEEIGELPVPTRTNYGFAGWYLDLTSGVPVDETMIIDSNIELFAKWVELNKTINYKSNGGLFENSETENTINYSYKMAPKTVYSHTSNIDNNGNANGQYESNLTTNDIVTIPGASKLSIEVWFSTENYYDWLAIYPEGVTPDIYNYSEATISNGQLMGGNSNNKPSDDSENHKTFIADGDTVQLFFRSDSGTNYYGYYAIIKPVDRMYEGDTDYLEPSKENYRFKEWNTEANGTGTAYNNEDEVINNMDKLNNNDDLYAQWREPYNYTVTLNANGGTVSPSSISVVEDSSVGELPTPTWAAHQFQGWYTELTGGVEIDEDYIPNGNVEVFAHWKNVYTVTFNPNEGTVEPATKEIIEGEEIGELPTPTRQSYSFAGWYTELTGGTKISESYIPTANIEVIARWDAAYVITFNANGGTVEETTRNVVQGQKIGTLPTPENNGDYSPGWYTGLTDGIQITSSYVPTSDMEVYARWVGCNGFATTSWSNIKTNVETDPTMYPIGCEKEVDLGELGVHKVRVANNTNPSICSTEGFSQTACGFVLEFTDIISKHRMNKESFIAEVGNGNVGSWKYSDMRAYVNSGEYYTPITYEHIDYSNNGIYSLLPADLKSQIISTKTVTGVTGGNTVGIDDRNNYVAEGDKLYLLAPREVYGKDGAAITNDSGEEYTRQLDFYKNNGIVNKYIGNTVLSDYLLKINRNSDEYHQGPGMDWWLRTANYNNVQNFFKVDSYGQIDGTYRAISTYGVSPAFRISDLSNITHDNHTITFNANGGQTDENSRIVVYDNRIGDLPIPTRSNYTFVGWYTGLTDGIEINSSYRPTANTDLYARWVDNSDAGYDFATSSWSDIVSAINNGKTAKLKEAMYKGTTRNLQIDFNDDGEYETYKLRVANVSTPAECNESGYSQSACGVVIEIAEDNTLFPITYQMNTNSLGNRSGTGNNGGWQECGLRTYLNTTIYDMLPSDLKSHIINTTIVSGHGNKDSSNFTTTDKLYLPSTKEIYGKEGLEAVIYNDTAESETRQLDYYEIQGITTANYSKLRKSIDEYGSRWLRTSVSNTKTDFYYMYGQGGWSKGSSSSLLGANPAFRIG